MRVVDLQMKTKRIVSLSAMALSLLFVVACHHESSRTVVNTVRIDLTNATFPLHGSVYASATAIDAEGNEILNVDRTIVSTDTSIIEVVREGNRVKLVGVGAGSVSIAAQAGAIKTTRLIEVTCPTPKEAPTIHQGTIQANETWRAEDSPHLIADHLLVAGAENAAPPTLTIESCARVLVRSGKKITVGTSTQPGVLSVKGGNSDAGRVIFSPEQETETWQGIVINSHRTDDQATPLQGSALHYTTIAKAGSGAANAAALSIFGSAEHTLRGIRVVESQNYGIRFAESVRLSAESDNIAITGAQKSAWFVDPASCDAVPPNSDSAYTLENNGLNGIEVSGGQIRHVASWRVTKFPYLISDTVSVGNPDLNYPALLILPPGATLRFAKKSPAVRLQIGLVEHGLGGFYADGEPERGITFESNSETPAAADWGGIVRGPFSYGFFAEFLTVRHAGAPLGLVGYDGDFSTAEQGGIVLLKYRHNFTRIVYSHFEMIDGYGFVRGYAQSPLDVLDQSTLTGNVFESLTNPKQTVSPSSPLILQTPAPTQTVIPETSRCSNSDRVPFPISWQLLTQSSAQYPGVEAIHSFAVVVSRLDGTPHWIVVNLAKDATSVEIDANGAIANGTVIDPFGNACDETTQCETFRSECNAGSAAQCEAYYRRCHYQVSLRALSGSVEVTSSSTPALTQIDAFTIGRSDAYLGEIDGSWILN